MSDDDKFSVHSEPAMKNRQTIGLQTSVQHFKKIEQTIEYQQRQQAKRESTDWALSPIFDEVSFAKGTVKDRKKILENKLT